MEISLELLLIFHLCGCFVFKRERERGKMAELFKFVYDTGLMGEAWLCDSFVFERDRDRERERQRGGVVKQQSCSRLCMTPY